MTGTEGYAWFVINDSESFKVTWNNPYVGSNSYSYTTPKGFVVLYSGGGGDRAVTTFMIKESEEVLRERKRKKEAEQKRLKAQREKAAKEAAEKEKQREIQRKKDRERARRRRKQKEDAKIINVLNRELGATVTWAGQKAEEYELKQKLMENSKLLADYATDKAYNIKQTVQDPQVQANVIQTAKSGIHAAWNVGSWGFGAAWNLSSKITNYGIDTYNNYKSTKEPSPECPPPELSLTDYYISYIAWYIEPLQNPAKHLSGKHSKVYVEFDAKYINTKWVIPKIIFAVERHQNDKESKNCVFIVEKRKLRNNKKSEPWECSQKYDKLKQVNLRQFLIKCVEENAKQYQLDKKDCHCLGQNLWGFCTDKKFTEKPNPWLTKMGKGINYKLPKNNRIFGQISIKELDPRNDTIIYGYYRTSHVSMEMECDVIKTILCFMSIVFDKKYDSKNTQNVDVPKNILNFLKSWDS
eukprot:135591_1